MLTRAVAVFGAADVVLSDDGAVVVDGRRLEHTLLISEVEETVALWARLPAVRAAVDVVIAPALRHRHAVMEGRDVCARLWPRAQTRLFLSASLEARAGRVVDRQGTRQTLAAVRARLARRDAIDAGRAVDAMGPAPGALVIDTTTSSERDVVAAALAAIGRAMGSV